MKVDKYGNNIHLGNAKRIYIQDGLPVLDNMILPSDETIEKVLQPFTWVKDRIAQSMKDGILSPFPKIEDSNPSWTKDIKDYISIFDVSKIDTNLYPGFLEKIKIISDFLQEDSADIFMSSVDEYGLKVNFIKSGVIHNQYDVLLDLDELELILFNENDPFHEMSKKN